MNNKKSLENMLHSFNRYVRNGLAAGLLAVSSYAGVPPQLPINYWDSPTTTGCTTCNANTGVFRDGLHFLDNKNVELMMDCDGNGSKETNVNTGAFQFTLSSGAYDILVEEETAITCGYNVSLPSRNKGDARIDGLIAYPKNLAFITPGDSVQRRLDVYALNLKMVGVNAVDWSPGIPEAIFYDLIRGHIDDLKDSTPLGLEGITASPTVCFHNGTAANGVLELIENPLPGKAFFYVVRPRTNSEVGNYGVRSTGVPRVNPATNDCPV